MSEQETQGKSTPLTIRVALQELLRTGYVEADKSNAQYQVALSNLLTLNAVLEPLDLCVRVDEVRGIAYLAVNHEAEKAAERDEWSHPLVRRQRLTLEQSLLVVILRQCYLAQEQERGVGSGNVVVTIDDVMNTLQLYLRSSGSDATDQRRLRQLVSQVSAHGVVTEFDEHDRAIVKPLIVHLANPETLSALLAEFEAVTCESKDDD